MEKTEGTLFLDGILEGRLPKAPDGSQRLREWKDFAESHGLGFSLQIEGAAFSLLTDSRPMAVEKLGDSPSDVIRQALDQLLTIFSPEERRGLASTVRSIEYRKGVEVQTLYLVGSDGSIRCRERSISASTEAPPRRLKLREKVYLSAIALLIALLVLALSSFFVNYRVLWSALVEGVTPLDTRALEIETTHFTTYFFVAKASLTSDRTSLVLTVKRTPAFPRDDASVRARFEAAGNSVPERLALEALARGYVRCEFFDRDGKFLSYSWQRIAELREKETVDLLIALPPKDRPARIVLSY